MKLPLTVREKTTKIELVDADGEVIAFQELQGWGGSSASKHPEFAREAFAQLAAAANARPNILKRGA